MSARLYIEGSATGADSKEMQSRCREGFSKLLQKCGFAGIARQRFLKVGAGVRISPFVCRVFRPASV